MSTSNTSRVIHLLRRAVLLRDGAGLTDGQLLECFVSQGDDAAFATLVRRHGPMVWGVCRRVLRSHHDAEDAFQATFLVLVRRAAAVVPRDMVANWLYGVARQTALKAQATVFRRKAKELQVAQIPEPAVEEQYRLGDLQSLLDQELSRLPDKYRIAVVLCDLEGKTRREAARQLALPEGTLSGRLTRGRTMLAKRLARQGVALAGGASATLLLQSIATAGFPTSVLCSTIKTASIFAAGRAAAAGSISVRVAALADGVLKTMFLNKLKSVLVPLVLIVAVLGGGSSFLLPTHAAQKPKDPLVIPLKAVDEKKRTVDDFNKAILAAEAKYWEAIRTFDADAVKQIYAEDGMAFSERGRSVQADAVAVAKRLGDANIKFRDVEIVRMNNDGAIITYLLDCDTVNRDGTVLVRWRNCRVSNVWARRDGRWFLVFSQMTQMPAGSTAAHR